MKRAAMLLALAAGCAHEMKPYVAKHREYTLEKEEEKNQIAATPGSLWREGYAGQIFSDARALRQNDLVVIKVEEIADARRSSDTGLSRDQQTKMELQAFLNAAGLVQTNNRNVDLGINGSSSSQFNANGQTGRTERLTATVPSVVRKVLPNGNLFVEGHRTVLVNSEEQHFYISGVIRPIDIDQDDSVKSSALADAEIEFTGQGVLSENQQQGGLAKFFSHLWPF
ncbi:MAG TPA: flagellar basal body L-ring protein FlgH [Myxococcales bacterium]|jgi:flagellar L-ring protein precursor FlgH|nr:flagellar basal body L-ring protein FlgH [Myxococcales bacterium]